MQLSINGEMREARQGESVESLLLTMGIAPQKVAVELNGVIVPRSQYAHTPVAAHDRLEVVQFVGGG